MRLPPTTYRFEDRARPRAILRQVAARLPSRKSRPSKRRRTYYDTFDWRVFRRGGALGVDQTRRTTTLRWLDLQGEIRHQAAISEQPGFARQLPPGPLRAGLEPIVAVRRLLPIVEVRATADTLRIVDKRDQTVARLRLEESSASPVEAGGVSTDLPPTLQALPVRGFDSHFHELLQLLEDEQKLQRATRSELELAGMAIGRRPGDYSSKLDVPLEPDMRSDQAARILHGFLLKILERNVDGVRRDLDTEFLHDFRVAVRRTRVALSQLKGAIPASIVGHFKTEFSWLGKVTGPTRDLHVCQLEIPAYRSSLPESSRGDLDSLDEFLDSRLKLEHRGLVEALDCPRYGSLIHDWKSFLRQPAASVADSAAAATPILELASSRIGHLHKGVLARGQAISDDSPAAALHRLRIECKKLRYMLELCRNLFDAATLAPLVRALKRLQDYLGDLNDMEVQQKSLRSFAITMAAEGLGSVDTFLTMGRLIEHLAARLHEQRQDFPRRFSRFSRRKTEGRFERLLERAREARA